MFCWWVVAASRLPAGVAVTALIGTNVAMALPDVATDAAVAMRSRAKPQFAADLQVRGGFVNWLRKPHCSGLAPSGSCLFTGIGTSSRERALLVRRQYGLSASVSESVIPVAFWEARVLYI